MTDVVAELRATREQFLTLVADVPRWALCALTTTGQPALCVAGHLHVEH